MSRHGCRLGVALLALGSVVGMVPNGAAALVTSPVVQANTLNAACVATVSWVPVSYTPGAPSHGTITATVNAPCVGSGFTYGGIFLSVTRYDTPVCPLGCWYSAGPSRNCTGSTCSVTYSFSGAPSPSWFEAFAIITWTSTAGYWLWATPSDDYTVGPEIFGLGTGCYDGSNDVILLGGGPQIQCIVSLMVGM